MSDEGEASSSSGTGFPPDPSWDLYALLGDAAEGSSSSGSKQPPASTAGTNGAPVAGSTSSAGASGGTAAGLFVVSGGGALLSSSSSAKDIDRAYRRAAKRLHPDKNPDPKAAVLFAQLQSVYAYLSDASLRASYDARLAAAAARAAKDAALDSSLARMKRDLLEREAAAAQKAIQVRNAKREADLRRQAPSAAEQSRAQNEALLRSLQAQGKIGAQPPRAASHQTPIDLTASAPSSSSLSSSSSRLRGAAAALDEPSGKRPRTEPTAGARSGSGNGIHVNDEREDEQQRTLLLRWGKAVPVGNAAATSAAPTVESLRALVVRCVPAERSAATAAAGLPVLEHVLLRGEKRRAMLLFSRRADAATALPALQAAAAAGAYGPPPLEVQWLDDSRRGATSTAPLDSGALPSSFVPSASPTSTAATASSPFLSAASPAAATPSSSSAPADYEQATLSRLQAIAQRSKLKKMQQQQQQQQQEQQAPQPMGDAEGGPVAAAPVQAPAPS